MHNRRKAILQELEIRKSVKVKELSSLLGFSEVTIRNDLKEMDAEGLLIRTHGGATLIEKDYHKYEAASIYKCKKEKELIAKKAFDYIEDGDTLILDDASSTFYLAQIIKNDSSKRLVVVTNSLLIGNELSYVDHVKLFIVGGLVEGHLASTMGETAIKTIQSIRADKAFIGVHGINLDVGITSIGTMQMEIKQAILKTTSEIFVLADSSKFTGGYLKVICPLDCIDVLITDNMVSKDIIKKAKLKNINLQIGC